MANGRFIYTGGAATHCERLEILKYFRAIGIDVVARALSPPPYSSAKYYQWMAMTDYIKSLGHDLRFIRFAEILGVSPCISHHCWARSAHTHRDLDRIWYLARQCQCLLFRGDIKKYMFQYDSLVGVDRAWVGEKFLRARIRAEPRVRGRAARRIYFWWLRRCYALDRATGRRARGRNLAEFRRVMAE